MLMLLLVSTLCSGLILGTVGPQAAPALKHYTGPKMCGFEFDYPSDWATVVPSSKENRCSVQLRPRDYAERMSKWDVDVYTVTVAVEHGDFLAVAGKNGFDFVKGKWVVLGRQGAMTHAEVVMTKRWHGLRGVASVGCFFESGGNAGLCNQPVLVLRDDGENMWSMTGGAQSQHVFTTILTTLRFVEQ